MFRNSGGLILGGLDPIGRMRGWRLGRLSRYFERVVSATGWHLSSVTTAKQDKRNVFKLDLNEEGDHRVQRQETWPRLGGLAR